jgi:hypothetical protein
MNFLQTAYAAVLIGLSSNAYAAVNGINYDPAHTDAWKNAQQSNQFETLKSIFSSDLDQIKKMGFNTIKTYFSAFCVKNGPPNCINPAQVAKDKGLKVLLGVFEFRNQDGCDNQANCKRWTKTQVDDAIAAAKASDTKDTILGIVVGNEDMFEDQGKDPDGKERFIAVPEMQKRIVDDINTIRKGCDPSGDNCQALSIPVTTAQRQGDWCGGKDPGCDPNRQADKYPALNQDDPHGVFAAVNGIIGANIFPYWGGAPERVIGHLRRAKRS